MEEELRALSPDPKSDDRFYDIIADLTGSEDEAHDYLYNRDMNRRRAAVMRAVHGA